MNSSPDAQPASSDRRANTLEWLRRAAWLAPTAVAVAWASVLDLAFKPGLMSPDSFVQWGQGLTLHFSNWHPPFIALLYGIVARVSGKPTPMLFLQLLAMSMGLALLVRRRPLVSAAVLAVLLAAPPLWAIGVTHWKDVLMASFLMLAVAALARERPLVALPFLVFATLSRHNALAAAVPLAILGAWQLARVRPHPVRRTALLSAGALVVMGLASPVFEKASGTIDEWPAGQVLAHDLAGIYMERPELLGQSVFADQVSAEDLKADFTPVSVVPLFWRGDNIRHLDVATLAPNKRAIMLEWLRVVPANLGPYVRHRLFTLQTLLGVRHGDVCFPFNPGVDPNPYGYKLHETMLTRRLLAVREELRNTVLFRGWVWLLASGLLTALALRPGHRNWLAAAIGASSVLYTGAYAMIGTTCDLRMVYWSIVASLAAAYALMQGVGSFGGPRLR